MRAQSSRPPCELGAVYKQRVDLGFGQSQCGSISGGWAVSGLSVGCVWAVSAVPGSSVGCLSAISGLSLGCLSAIPGAQGEGDNDLISEKNKLRI